MALTDKLNTAYDELTQAQKVSSARALMQPIRDDLIRTNAELQAIADSGSLDTVDGEIKSALVACWDIYKAAQAALAANPIIVELLDWRP